MTGIAGSWLRAFGNDPNGFQLTSITRVEAGTGTFQYARGSFESTVTRPVAPVWQVMEDGTILKILLAAAEAGAAKVAAVIARAKRAAVFMLMSCVLNRGGTTETRVSPRSIQFPM